MMPEDTPEGFRAVNIYSHPLDDKYECEKCGALVFDCEIHKAWHETLREEIGRTG